MWSLQPISLIRALPLISFLPVSSLLVSAALDSSTSMCTNFQCAKPKLPQHVFLCGHLHTEAGPERAGVEIQFFFFWLGARLFSIFRSSCARKIPGCFSKKKSFITATKLRCTLDATLPLPLPLPLPNSPHNHHISNNQHPLRNFTILNQPVDTPRYSRGGSLLAASYRSIDRSHHTVLIYLPGLRIPGKSDLLLQFYSSTTQTGRVWAINNP